MDRIAHLAARKSSFLAKIQYKCLITRNLIESTKPYSKFDVSLSGC